MRDLPDDDSWIPARQQVIGDRIRAERIRQGLTQDQVWMTARITRWTYQRIERGQDAKLSTLLRVAWVLQMSLGDLEE